MADELADMGEYLQSCKTGFWKKVFREEIDYIVRALNGAKDVLSVGCGPATVEAGLSQHGYNVTALDISEEALAQVPDGVRTILGSAEIMNLPASCFDAAIYLASMQFIEGYRQAVRETARVLRSGGRILVMLLNPDSAFFTERVKGPTSYVNRMKHRSLQEIEAAIAKYFTFHTEYFLGISGEDTFESQRPDVASLYVINGTKHQ